MKFKVGDQVKITAGKEKGKKGKIVKVFPKQNKVIVEDVNIYVKHIKSYGDRPGEKIKRERPLPTANVAIINDKGQIDRIGYKVLDNGDKVRVYKKTGKEIEIKASKKSKKSKKKSKK
jgi:large subunit ribosomal protein L24